MKIGDRIFVHGYIDEIRKDTVIVRNDGGYFGTTPSEVTPSAQPEIIRCKECKHRDPEDKKCDCGHDIQWQLPRQDDWYCADAERREE